MTPVQFEVILRKVEPYIIKEDSLMRKSIPPAERLTLTLRYLATGETQTSQQFLFRIPQCTISVILNETICALYNSLKEENLPFPQTEEHWKNISKDFYNVWGFPLCLGAIDGKHCTIMASKRNGSNYFNYKGGHSIVLMAIADGNYRFIYADVGINGRMSDGGIWQRSSIKKDIEDQRLKIPEPEHLPNSSLTMPYTFISDDAFPLTVYNMKPYSRKNLSVDEERFNYMLSRSRRVVENAFGILANKWRVLFNPIQRTPKRAIPIVLACLCLHNFLRSENMKSSNIDYLTEDELQNIISTNYTPIQLNQGRQSNSGKINRDILSQYFKNLKDVLGF